MKESLINMESVVLICVESLEIPCIFEKQWRADGSETYDIWVVK